MVQTLVGSVLTVFSYFLWSWCSGIWALIAPPRVSQFLEMAKNSAQRVSFRCKRTSPKHISLPPPPTLNHHLYWTLMCQISISPALITPWSDTRQPRKAKTPQRLLKLFKLTKHLHLPMETTIKAFTHDFPSLLPHNQPWYFPMWPCIMWCNQSSWELWVRNYLFFLSFILFFFFFLFFFLPHNAPWGILVPQSGIEPASPIEEAWSLNHWTAREVPKLSFQ